MADTNLNVSLPEALEAYVQERVAEGGYSDPSDFVRTLIREHMQRHGQEQLEALLLEGMDSGEPEPLDWEAVRAVAYEKAGMKSSRRG
jgi:antitoxin ParD1/3/4